MGAGYETIDHAMHGEYLWHVLLALAVLKILATTLSFSSGTPGGMFAPVRLRRVTLRDWRRSRPARKYPPFWLALNRARPAEALSGTGGALG